MKKFLVLLGLSLSVILIVRTNFKQSNEAIRQDNYGTLRNARRMLTGRSLSVDSLDKVCGKFSLDPKAMPNDGA